MIGEEGMIDLIVGPMFAGKTTEMLRRITRARLAKRRCVIMKWSTDTRYAAANKVCTHDLTTDDAIPCDQLMPHYAEALKYDVIGIDEGQFFPDVVEFAEKLANSGKRVIVAALDGDFMRAPFGKVLELISKSESLTKLTAVCQETGGDAAFSQRKTHSTDVHLIGGADIYRAASRSAYKGTKTDGEIHLTLGPVKSGKTTELTRILTRHQIAGKTVLLLSPCELSKRTAKFEVRCSAELPPVESLFDYDVIGVDNAHQYEKLPKWCDALADSGKLVVVSALDSKPDQRPYQNIIELFPLCERVEKLDGVCTMTGMPAVFNCVINGVVCSICRKALRTRSSC